jgi:hypothetical protein
MKKSLRILTVLSIAASSILFTTPSNAAVNDLFSKSAADAVSILTSGASGISVVAGSEVSYGSVKSFTSIDFGAGFSLPNPGIFLNSGQWEGATINNTGGAGTIRNNLNSILSAAGSVKTTQDLSALKFDFTTTSSFVTSISFDFLFASEELYTQDWDVAAVLVDGTNYAFLSNGSIITVKTSSNLCNFLSSINSQSSNSACTSIDRNISRRLKF